MRSFPKKKKKKWLGDILNKIPIKSQELKKQKQKKKKKKKSLELMCFISLLFPLGPLTNYSKNK